MPVEGEWLLEPDPAVIHAGLIRVLAESIGASQLDAGIAYLASGDNPGTALVASYRVIGSMPYHEKRLREALRLRGIGHLTVKKRGFPLSPEEVQRRLHLRGDQDGTIALTTIQGRHVAILLEAYKA
jgi:hypothetical protein